MRVNLVLVGIKLFIVLFVIIAGIVLHQPRQLLTRSSRRPQPARAPRGPDPAADPGRCSGCEPAAFGIGGIFAGAALVFFAYIGFDVVATTAEEAKNPQRDLPIGIIASLVICTILYVAVALVITGMVKYDQIDPKAALATAFTAVGQPGYATLIAAGAVAGLTTVVLTLMIGASRVVFAMSRDHLLPPPLAQGAPEVPDPVGDHHRSSARSSRWSPALTPIGKLEEMVNIGTLTAFILVSSA